MRQTTAAILALAVLLPGCSIYGPGGPEPAIWWSLAPGDGLGEGLWKIGTNIILTPIYAGYFALFVIVQMKGAGRSWSPESVEISPGP